MRASGILMPISSLPSAHGIGAMGAEARRFVEFLSKAGQAYWQILPICPTSYGDSPYQSFSTFAGNPYFIDLDELAKRGLLLPEEYENIDWESAPDTINYGALYEKRYKVLRCAANRLLAKPNAAYRKFVKENAFWLPDYALFMALKLPTEVAGCPPDGFSATGQLWGNPLFDWDAMAKTGYAWWVRRIRHMCSIYDVVRIDHFRGFAGYYAIPYGDKTAEHGRWREGPGYALFAAIKKKLGSPRIIAEDLGFLTEDVNALLKECGYPGMKVLEFAFDSRDGGDYRPHSYPNNCIAYVGTHDNEPVNGWMETAAPEDVERAVRYLNLTKKEGYHWGMMRGVWSSVADLAVVQAQDVLGLGHESRMNTPSTLGGNWCWRAEPEVFNSRLARRLHGLMELYGRLPE